MSDKSDLKLLYRHSAREVVAMLAEGSVSIEELLQCLHDRICEVDPLVNALPTLCFDRAREAAVKLQAFPAADRGPLQGLPVSIKDLTPVEGVRTTFGSRVFEEYVPTGSCQLVTRIERRGGVIYAKSNTPEFGAGGITFNDVFGRTASPHNTAFASGGSSGGAAASLACGTAWLSHGSDMAGSLRTPAALCGVASLRPSPGTIRSDSPYLPFDVLGADGPMARDVLDLALFADVMKNEPSDACQVAAASPQWPLKIAVSADLGVTDVDPVIRHNFFRLVDRLADAGCTVIESAPDLSCVHESFDVLRAQVFAVGLEEAMRKYPGVMKEELEWNIRAGLAQNTADIRRALRSQGSLVNGAAQFMRDFDLLLCPACSVANAPVTQRYVGFDQGVGVEDYYRWLGIAYATTLTSLPVITLPFMPADSTMPSAVQLVGKPWGETNLFSCARQLEMLLEYPATPIDPIMRS